MSLSKNDFHFGIESEYLLVDSRTFAPLWYRDLNFSKLNEILEQIPLEGIQSLEGLELEPPHRKTMPYVVEGYHVPDAEFRMIDILPKGVEIRTPVTDSIDECLSQFRKLYDRLQIGLEASGYRAVSLSHHPIYSKFTGQQNKRRYDFWLWAMEVMTTYGPDINVSLPAELNQRLDVADLEAKINYYGPAMTALSVGSPFLDGDLWRIRGDVGKSFRTYRRSVIAPPIEIHPDEGFRLEFKVFEMSWRMEDYRNYFLLFLALLLDEGLAGRASAQTRIYDLGAVARFGLSAPEVYERAAELLERAPNVLSRWGFHPDSLVSFQKRLQTRITPADEMIEIYQREKSLTPVLRHLARLE